MKKKMMMINKYILMILLMSFFVSNLTFGQANEDLDMLVSDTKNDLMVVVGGGLAGAVLGLSTLSFVEEPKEHTRNIVVGASVGIIFGVGYVAFSQAAKTQEMMYGEGDMPAGASIRDSKSFNTFARSSWHYNNVSENFSGKVTPYQLNYTVKF